MKNLKIYSLVFVILFLFSYSATVYATNNKTLFKKGPINPAFEDFLQKNKTNNNSILYSVTTQQYKTGLIPNPILLPKHRQFSVLGAYLPSSYDLRDDNLTTPVKNQGNYNTCWAFATYGSLESNLLKLGEEEDNFSENNLANKSGFSLGFDGGGNIDMSSAYLARGSGPVDASCDPYPNPGNSPDCPRVKYIENIVFLPGRDNVSDNDYLKSAVYEHGGVYTSMYWADGYYNDNDSTYYYSGTQSANHAVVIVGWDDNLSVPGAPGNGAWIVRNSWGSSWGDGGYFYVSYYDRRFAMGTNAYFEDEPDINNGSFNIYQYDTLGMESGYYCSNNSYVYGANVFSAQNTSKIKAVSVFVASPTSYEIEIYPYCDNPNSISENPIETLSGTFENAGFHTINLTYPIIIESGSKFCVIEKLSQSYAGADPLGIEEAIPGYSDAATGESGQSFISCDNGTTWTDLYDNFYNVTGATNVCLKAISISATPMIQSLSFSPNPQYVNETVTFTCSISDNSSALPYSWNFGDGTAISSDNTTTTHSYAKEGVYKVYIEVQDDNGTKEMRAGTVLIKPIGGDISYASDPTASDSPVYVITYNATIDNMTVYTPQDAESSKYITTYDEPENFTPQKVIAIDIKTNSIGGTATVTLTNLTIPNKDVYFYKYVNGEWINLQDNIECGDCNFKIINNNTISFNIRDGGILDNDGLVNGEVSDPLVIGTSTSTTTTSTTTTSDDGGGGGGCTASKSNSVGLLLIILAIIGLTIRKKFQRNS